MSLQNPQHPVQQYTAENPTIAVLDRDEVAGCLLPNDSNTVYVVLFWKNDAPSNAALEKFSRTTWPGGLRKVILDCDSAAQINAWFRLSAPTIAIVRDGAVLAIENECSPNACSRLLACARTQLTLLEPDISANEMKFLGPRERGLVRRHADGSTSNRTGAVPRTGAALRTSADI